MTEVSNYDKWTILVCLTSNYILPFASICYENKERKRFLDASIPLRLCDGNIITPLWCMQNQSNLQLKSAKIITKYFCIALRNEKQKVKNFKYLKMTYYIKLFILFLFKVDQEHKLSLKFDNCKKFRLVQFY